LQEIVKELVPPTNKENENGDSHANDQNDNDAITPESDLSDLNRRIWVVTTASLPWRTGTAVNPLARALYLTRGRPKHYVGLVIPWLESQEDQAKIYGSDSTFETQQDQEAWIRNYAKERVHCESK
jgi:digalactosyldiacylglycerol synthase